MVNGSKSLSKSFKIKSPGAPLATIRVPSSKTEFESSLATGGVLTTEGVTEEVLFPGTKSDSLADIVAVFNLEPKGATITVISRVALLPFNKVPIFHTPETLL